MLRALAATAFLAGAGTADAQLTSDNITVLNHSRLPQTITPVSRVQIGVRGDYKPWVTQLKTGELLMVHRCNSPEANCSNQDGSGTPNTNHAVLWRSPADGSSWTRTEHVMQKSPPASDLDGGEWSVNTFADGTVFMLNGGCHSFTANTTFNCTLCWLRGRPGFNSCGGNGASYNVLEVQANTVGQNMPAGVFMFGGNQIWHSADSGATFNHFKTVQNEHWKASTTDDFFEQSGTPFLTSSGALIHVPRVGINPKWDETDGSQLFRSTDGGSSFQCLTNAADDFCKRNNADPHHAYVCEGGVGAYACSALNKSFGGPGDMYPHMLQLHDGRAQTRAAQPFSLT